FSLCVPCPVCKESCFTTDPNVLRWERFHEIGHLLTISATLLVDRWCLRAIQEQPTAKRVHQDAMRDELVSLVMAIGRELADDSADEPGAHQLLAVEHGEQRWD